MRVLHVNDYRSAGGCEVLGASTLRLLRETGVETALLTGDDVPGRPNPWRYVRNGAACRVLRQRLREFEPDVLVGSSFGGAVAVTLLQRGV